MTASRQSGHSVACARGDLGHVHWPPPKYTRKTERDATVPPRQRPPAPAQGPFTCPRAAPAATLTTAPRVTRATTPSPPTVDDSDALTCRRGSHFARSHKSPPRYRSAFARGPALARLGPRQPATPPPPPNPDFLAVLTVVAGGLPQNSSLPVGATRQVARYVLCFAVELNFIPRERCCSRDTPRKSIPSVTSSLLPRPPCTPTHTVPLFRTITS